MKNLRGRLDRDSQDFRDAKNHVYGLAHNVCHDGIEQSELLSTLQKIEEESYRNGASGAQTIRNLLCPILDGLMWGNWPWAKRKLREEADAKIHGGSAQG